MNIDHLHTGHDLRDDDLSVQVINREMHLLKLNHESPSCSKLVNELDYTRTIIGRLLGKKNYAVFYKFIG